MQQLNQTLIRLEHKGKIVNDILQKLANQINKKHQIDAKCNYHNHILDEKSSYLTTLACQFGRFSYMRLPFRVVQDGDMFQRKTDEIFKELLYVFVKADHI